MSTEVTEVVADRSAGRVSSVHAEEAYSKQALNQEINLAVEQVIQDNVHAQVDHAVAEQGVGVDAGSAGVYRKERFRREVEDAVDQVLEENVRSEIDGGLENADGKY